MNPCQIAIEVAHELEHKAIRELLLQNTLKEYKAIISSSIVDKYKEEEV
jgi:hypothetical protein